MESKGVKDDILAFLDSKFAGLDSKKSKKSKKKAKAAEPAPIVI
jgi:hypothetical protein